MKVLNICRFLPIEGFPAENDITIKVYADLESHYGVESIFIMPLPHVPKWACFLKNSLKSRYKIINRIDYIDKKYGLPIFFFQGYFPNKLKLGIKNDFKWINFQFPFFKQNLFKKVEMFKPDIVHAHTVGDALYAYKIFLEYKIPYIITLRGVYTEMYELGQIRKVMNCAKYIFTPSFSLQKSLQSKFNVNLLPHGIDKIWFSNEKRNFVVSHLKLVSTARLHDWKNIQLVLESIAHLRVAGLNVSYNIIGEGYYEQELKSLVDRLGIRESVVFHGFKTVPEMISIYKESNIFILMSYPETFGRAFFEAAAQGLLIVGRKNTGIDGHLTKDEAFILEPDSSLIAKTLRSITKDLYYKMTKKSYERALNLENNKIIEKYYEILKKHSEKP